MTPPPDTQDATDDDEEKDDVAGVDWGDIFTRFYVCTNITKPLLLEMSFLEVMAINRNLPKYKPLLFSSGSEEENNEKPRPTKEQTIADRMAFVAKFNK